jgi:hypothetical protein
MGHTVITLQSSTMDKCPHCTTICIYVCFFDLIQLILIGNLFYVLSYVLIDS